MASITTRAGKGSALTWTEADANITNLNTAKIENVVEDLTPQLGGDLDVNAKAITSASNGNVRIEPNGSGNIALTPTTGKIILGALDFPTGTGTNGQVLTTNGSTAMTWTTVSGGGSSALDDLTDVVITAAATNDVLVYNGTNWVDTAASTLTVGTATVGSTVTLTADNATNATNYPLFVNAATGNLSPRTDTGFVYNPSTGVLGATQFNGIHNGAVGSVTPSTGAFTTLSANNTVSFTAAVNINPASANISISPTGTGSVSIQPASTLTINSTAGGTINNCSIGATTASTGRFTTVTSTVATGTAPFTVASTTNVANLNASSLNGATFAAPGPIGATTPAAGTFTSVNFKNPIEAIFDLGTTGGTIAPDPANGSVQKITLNSALTINAFTNATAGESLTLIIYGGTAYTSITSTMKFAGGVKTLTATAGCIDILTVYYDGTTYFASLGKGFA